MKLQLLSDLHLEVDPSFTPQVAPQAQLLVLAGDIGAAAMFRVTMSLMAKILIKHVVNCVCWSNH